MAGLNIGWSVQGDLSLADKLMEVRNPRRFIRPALAKGATILRRSIQSLIPPRESQDSRQGQVNTVIRRAIGSRIKPRSGQLILTVGSSIGSTHSKRLGLSRDQAIARLAYFTGTKQRRTKSGRSTGYTTPRDYITRGGQSAAGQAIHAISADLARRLDLALEKQRSNERIELVKP